MDCPKCTTGMEWKGVMRGYYCPTCDEDAADRKAEERNGAAAGTRVIQNAVQNVISTEAIAGPGGQPVWAVTAQLRRPGRENYTETIHVRAVTYDGALLVAKEMLLDWLDGDAAQVLT